MLKIIYIALGILSIGYYFLISLWSRFGLSLSIIWIILGIVLILAGLLTGIAPMAIKVIFRAGLIIGLIGLVALLVPIVGGMTKEAPKELDYIVVLGAKVEKDETPSLALLKRSRAAAKYLKENPNTIAVATGGKGKDEPISEALCIKRLLIEMGVDESRIILEEESENTAQNMKNTVSIIGTDKKTGIVTSNYHVARALKLAKANYIDEAYGIAAEYGGPTLFHYMVREAIGLVADKLRGNY